MNTGSSSTTSISLAIHDRQQKDERNAEQITREIISFCQQVMKFIILFYLNNKF